MAQTVNIIGAGNVATHLAKALVDNGYTLKCVMSRKKTDAAKIAKGHGASAVDSIEDMPQSDVTIIATPDNSVGEIAKALAKNNVKGIVAHTSGATPMEALAPLTHRGVLYPCMTFSKGDKVDMSLCPFLIEAYDTETLSALKEIAGKIGNNAIECDSEGRRRLHLAAVLASNFTNHLLKLAKDVMEQAGLPFDLLRPLTQQTIAKAFALGPFDSQTGPARRGDTQTIERHRTEIGNNARLKEIYDTLTASIRETYN